MRLRSRIGIVSLLALLVSSSGVAQALGTNAAPSSDANAVSSGKLSDDLLVRLKNRVDPYAVVIYAPRVASATTPQTSAPRDGPPLR